MTDTVAEAHVVELAEALEGLIRWHRNEGDDTDEPPGKFLQKARTVLAAMPADALKRARAKDEVVKWADEMRGDGGAIRPYAFEEMEKALARLDALDRPTKEDTGT